MSEADLRRRLDSVTEQLLATYEELEVLSTVSEIASSTTDVAVAGGRILREAAALLEADVAFIYYSDPELKGEEPAPLGLSADERDALAAVLARTAGSASRPILMAPFAEGAGVPHAPDALLAAPLRIEEQALGALCLGRRGEGRTFAAGDLKIAGALASSAASVLLQRKNLDLARLTRRLEERTALLKGIVAVSREITASLDLDRILHALVNLPARLLGFDRCAVAIDEGGRRLRAVSGSARVDRADAELRSLERLLDWAAGRGGRVLVQQAADDRSVPTAEPPEAAEQARAHMEASGARSALILPLRDDQGLLGTISFESAAAGFVDDLRLEAATILANQATVALRNARLYASLPLVGLLAPLRRGAARARSVGRRRLAVWGGVAVLALAAAVLGRWELRVPGRAVVLPAQVVQVSAPVRGVVREVGPWREGDRVPKGAVLARLEEHDLALRLSEASSRAETAARRVATLEAEGRAAEMGLARVEAERWRVEEAVLRDRVDATSLRAPIEGILLTPRLRERAGELLEVGGALCTLADPAGLRVEVAVREADADVLLRPAAQGGPVRLRAVLKFGAFPEVDFVAEVTHVRSAAEVVEGARSLVAEGVLREPAGMLGVLKPGMSASARVGGGERSIASLLVRRPYRFLRGLIWL